MKILIVEDDKSLLMAVEYRLRKENYQVETSMNGPTGLSMLETGQFDAVVLDRMLPYLDGISLLKNARAKGIKTPVLLLTAMDAIHDRVTGLDAGADDYLVKPFAMDELLARVRALIRRQEPWSPVDIVKAFDLSLDTNRYLLRCEDHVVSLSKREGALMEFLMRNQNQILPRSVLLDRVWSESIVEEGNLDIYVHFLRKRIAEVHSRCIIRTIRGIGYQLLGSPYRT